MHIGKDPDYYAARLRAEREAAAAATCDEARESHLELARQYLQLLESFAPPKLVGHPGGPERAEVRPAAEA